jgi:CheY-like chemotaxis protein
VSTTTSAVNANNVIQNSAVYDVASDGIRIGASGQPSDTNADVAQFNTVQNTVVEGYGRLYPSSKGITQGQGHDNGAAPSKDEVVVIHGAGNAVQTVIPEVDLVLMDIQMPVTDGPEASLLIREVERQGGADGKPAEHIPIVAMTAHSMIGYREECMRRAIRNR